jgi:hypothetical protein
LGTSELLTDDKIAQIGKAIQGQLKMGHRILSESGSPSDYHKISLVRNYCGMLETHFPEQSIVIQKVLCTWDRAQYKSTMEAVAMIDHLLDAIVRKHASYDVPGGKMPSEFC